MRMIMAMAQKDLLILMRDKAGLFWVTVFPLIMALFFGSIFSSGGDGGARSLKVAFVGVGDSVGVEAFATALAKSDAITLRRMALDSARDLVGRGKLVAYIHYTDTSNSVFGMFGPAKPSIKVGMDPVRRAEKGYLQGLVSQAYFGLLKDAITNPGALGSTLQEQSQVLDTLSGLDPAERDVLQGFFGSLDELLSLGVSDSSSDSGSSSNPAASFGDIDLEFNDVTVAREGPRSSWEITFPQSLQWALIGVAAAFAVGIAIERRRGTYLRLRLAPIQRIHILAGKGLACFIACVTSCALLLAIGIVIFGIRVVSPLGLVVALFSAAFCFVGLMMLISVLGKTEQAVAGAGWAILLIMSMTGGGMVPLMAMPKWMFQLGSISAVKWSILAMEGAIWRGFGVAEMMLPVGILLGMGIVGLGAGSFILSRSD